MSKRIIDSCVSLLNQKNYHEADSQLSKLVQQEPDNFNALQLLGIARHLLGDPRQAVELLEKAITIKQDFPAIHHNIAGIYKNLGEMQKSEQHFRQAISLKPDYAEAYQGLAELIRFKKEDPLIRQLNAQISNCEDQTLKMYLHFAAGKIHDDCKEYEVAFRHYTQANALKNANWNLDKHHQYLHQIRETYDAGYFSSIKRKGFQPASPIFIVGMPRSGSTLLEQILATHSKVFGAGELSDINSITHQIGSLMPDKIPYPACMPKVPEEGCVGLGSSYLRRVASLNTEKPSAVISVDKNLFNYRHLGFLYDLFPDVRIIHIQRHPLDTCLSCFFQNFTSGVDWSFSMEHITDYYQHYRLMMSHWERVLPCPVLTVKYEELIADPDTSAGKILSFCGLDWEENCLQFHKTRRAVRTASAWQVRQPLYQHAKGRWYNYRKQIESTYKELEAHIASYEKELNTATRH